MQKERGLKLLRLSIRNFKGCQDRTLNFDGSTVEIYGANRAGKSTLADAYSWCLFGKDSQGKVDFDIKPDGIESPEIFVEVEFDTITFRRVMIEKWTRPRGQSEKTFSGHELTYYVDGVPVTKRYFDARISEVLPSQHFKMLSDPRYFAEIHWAERRKLLLEIFGEKSDAEIIASNSELSELPGLLGRLTPEDAKKVSRDKKRRLDAELNAIPPRIEEAKRSGATPEISKEDALRRRAEIQAALAEAGKKRAAIESGGLAAQKRKELIEIEMEIVRNLNTWEKQRNSDWNTLTEKHSQLIKEYRKLTHLESDLDLKIKILREDWGRKNEEYFPASEINTVCPSCGQDIPEDRIQEARENLRQQRHVFNAAKSADLKKINEAGKKLVGELEATRVELTKINRQLSTVESEIKAHDERKFSPDPILSQRLNQLRDDLDNIAQTSKEELSEINSQVEALELESDKLNGILGRWQAVEAVPSRIKELEAQYKGLIIEREATERLLHLLEAFDEAKVRATEDTINSKFRFVSFRMFDRQINGGLEQKCDVCIGNRTWGSLSNSERIIAGLDIISTLSRHFGQSVPVWIDNAESTSQFPKTEFQQIRLFVSKADKELRMEKTNG